MMLLLCAPPDFLPVDLTRSSGESGESMSSLKRRLCNFTWPLIEIDPKVDDLAAYFYAKCGSQVPAMAM